MIFSSDIAERASEYISAVSLLKGYAASYYHAQTAFSYAKRVNENTICMFPLERVMLPYLENRGPTRCVQLRPVGATPAPRMARNFFPERRKILLEHAGYFAPFSIFNADTSAHISAEQISSHLDPLKLKRAERAGDATGYSTHRVARRAHTYRRVHVLLFYVYG